MKLRIAAAVLLLVSGAAWAAHLPSPYPINGSFIVMCASAGMLAASFFRKEMS